MTGIKFRRNNKVNLLDAKAGEIVFALDTNEWGLGLVDGSVSWRSHEILFKNLYLQGLGVPESSLGDIGMYYFDLEFLIVYQKQEAGWQEIDYPISQTVYDATYLVKGSVPTYADQSTIIKKDGTVKAQAGYIPTDAQDALTKGAVESAFGVLQPDGSTQMVDGYMATGDGVLTLNDTPNYVPPTTEPTEFGMLWNDNGVLKITVPPIPFDTFNRFPHEPDWGLSSHLRNILVPVNGTVVHLTEADGTILHSFNPPTIVGTSSDNYGMSTAFNDTHIFISRNFVQDGVWKGLVYVYDAVTKNLLFTHLEPNLVLGEASTFGYGLCVLDNGNFVSVDPYPDQTLQVGIHTGIGFIMQPDGTLVNTIGPSLQRAGEDWTSFGVEQVQTNGSLILVHSNPDWYGNIAFLDVFDSTGTHLFMLESPTDMATWNGLIPNFGTDCAINDHFIIAADTNLWEYINGVDGADEWNGVVMIYDLAGNFVQRLYPPQDVVVSGWGWGVAAHGDYFAISQLYLDHDVDKQGVVHVYDSNADLVTTLATTDPLDTTYTGDIITMTDTLVAVKTGSASANKSVSIFS